MKKIYVIFITLFLLAGLQVYAEEIVHYEGFGDLHIYNPGKADGFLILISGDGGWTRAAPVVADALSKEGSFVVGVEIKKYVRAANKAGGCVSVAKDLHELAKFVSKKYDLDNSKPVLLGYSSGATLVYAALAQANPGQFNGAMSFGFCADFEPAMKFCKGNGLKYTKGDIPNSVVLEPSDKIKDPWVTFQGSVDEVCDPHKTEEFTQQVSTGEFVLIPKAGHGFKNLDGWMPEFHRVWPRFQGMSQQ